MIRLIADGKTIEVLETVSLLEALNASGFKVPSLCHHSGGKHRSYCYVCAVEKKDGAIVPSCAVKPEEGMEIQTDTPALWDLRRSALDLILASHRGDCHAPCERVCPFGADVPGILRTISGHSKNKKTVPDAVLPFGELTCRLCHAPCEKACRRGRLDKAVGIREQLMSFAFTDEKDHSPVQSNGEILRTDLVSGFVMAWMMARKAGKAPSIHFDIKSSEKAFIAVTSEISWSEIHQKIFTQAKKMNIALVETTGVPAAELPKGRSPVAAWSAGFAHTPMNLRPVSPSLLPAHLSDADWMELKKETDDSCEAGRCLHCDCRAKTDCLLKSRCEETGAASLHKPFVAKTMKKEVLPGGVFVDTGKCILCGACCDISQKAGSMGGFFLEGKGEACTLAWNPWAKEDSSLLQLCAKACPTGALTEPA